MGDDTKLTEAADNGKTRVATGQAPEVRRWISVLKMTTPDSRVFPARYLEVTGFPSVTHVQRGVQASELCGLHNNDP